MTAWGAGSAGGGLGKSGGNSPVSERNILADKFFRLAGVYLVAGATGPALFILVDMDEVQVPVTVSKACQFGCFRDQAH